MSGFLQDVIIPVPRTLRAEAFSLNRRTMPLSGQSGENIKERGDPAMSLTQH
jgi:hypothetical protein